MLMKRQFAILLAVFLGIIILGLMYGSQVVADLTVFYPMSVDDSGLKIVLSPNNTSDFSSNSQQKYHLVAQDTQRVVALRLNQLDLKGYYSVGIHNNQLEVTLPNDENTPYVINIITRVGKVEFIDGGPNSPPIGRQIRTTSEAPVGQEEVYEVLFVDKEITSIIPPTASVGEVFYQISLQPAAAKRFARFLSDEAKTYICLVIDKQVVNCSRMYHWSDNTLDILPNLSDGTGLSLADLAVFLNSGPLPTSLEVVTN